MSIWAHFCDPQRWAQAHFGGVALGDARRNARTLQVVAGWARQPGVSIPRLSEGHAGTSKAAYRLLGRPEATPDALQAPYRAHVHQQLAHPGTYLLVEDTTELSWPDAHPARGRRPGLGPVGAGKPHQQGVLLHSLVAAGPWPDEAGAPAAAAGPARPAIPRAPAHPSG